MSGPTLGAGTVLGGLLLLAAGICQLAQAPSGAVDWLLAVGLLASGSGAAGIHRRYRNSYGTLGLLGAVAAGGGQVLQAASAAAGALTGDPDHGLPLLLFVAGSVLFVPGLLALTVAVFRANAGRRWLGIVLIAGVLASGAAQDHGGTALFGVAWIVVGVLLATASRE